jgi:hypothetical protein
LRRRRQRQCAALGCHAIAARLRCSHFLAEDDIASLKNFSFVLSFIGPKMLRHLKVFFRFIALNYTQKSGRIGILRLFYFSQLQQQSRRGFSA